MFGLSFKAQNHFQILAQSAQVMAPWMTNGKESLKRRMSRRSNGGRKLFTYAHKILR